jgi:MFS family permease
MPGTDPRMTQTKKVTRLYYGFQFFFGMLLWVPIFYDYQKKLGLDDAQIFGIQSIYYLAFCLLEIPTGFLADVWGHRICMKAGALVLTVANLLPVLLPNYDGFLAHFLLVALARSLISGASSAYLYDYLKAHGEMGLYKEIEGKARAYGLVGKVVLWAAIGPLMAWQFELPYWLSAVFSAVALAYAWGFPAIPGLAGIGPRSPRSAPGRAQIWLQLGPALGILGRSPGLVLIMLQGIALFVLARIVSVNLFQPVLSAQSFEVATFGVIMSVMTVFEALGSAFPNVMRRRWNDLDSVFILTIVMALSVGALAWGGQAATILWFCVFSLACGLSFPIQRQLLNDAIPDSRYRATLISVESLMDRAVCAWVAAVLAGAVGGGRMNSFLIASSAISLVGMAVLWWVARRRTLSLVTPRR